MEGNKSINVLLIDESELDLMIMAQAFRITHSNYIITPLTNHFDAIEYLSNEQTEKPDIIIIDAKTLHICKDMFLSYLRNSGNLNKVPVIVLTSLAEEELCFSELELPQNCFIEKPFSLSELPDFNIRFQDFWSRIDYLNSRLN